MKVLTEVTGGGVFTARDDEDLPRIIRTIGLAVRYRYVLTYKAVHATKVTKTRESAADSRQHKVVVQLYPKEKFRGYSLPYYKRVHHSVQERAGVYWPTGNRFPSGPAVEVYVAPPRTVVRPIRDPSDSIPRREPCKAGR